ncbi:hypothetical protein [Apilactobacillus quenuiae]|uniref:hypothetical protein n=1 Tax=Apilactobacillus quenuiae TaxID=2008377 RepID=UPI000D015705|nr:hypothetical protein [Apilactobacillus quenuiae]
MNFLDNLADKFFITPTLSFMKKRNNIFYVILFLISIPMLADINNIPDFSLYCDGWFNEIIQLLSTIFTSFNNLLIYILSYPLIFIFIYYLLSNKFPDYKNYLAILFSIFFYVIFSLVYIIQNVKVSDLLKLSTYVNEILPLVIFMAMFCGYTVLTIFIAREKNMGDAYTIIKNVVLIFTLLYRKLWLTTLIIIIIFGNRSFITFPFGIILSINIFISMGILAIDQKDNDKVFSISEENFKENFYILYKNSGNYETVYICQNNNRIFMNKSKNCYMIKQGNFINGDRNVYVLKEFNNKYDAKEYADSYIKYN